MNLFSHSLGSLPLLSRAKSRSVSPENVYGEKGRGGMADLTEEPQAEVQKIGQHWNGPLASARDLGIGWKVRPYVVIPAGTACVIMDVSGPGMIQQVWMTPTGDWRHAILRVYWDDEAEPSIECPVGDFFACGWGKFAPVVSQAVCVNPGSALNCYWPMPFRRHCRITMENISPNDMTLYYQINYALQEIPDDAAYFHAQFRRVNPLPYKEVYTILDGVSGWGHYAGTYMAWGVNNSGWWGEGEIKFYLDGDREFPTICGTGTEDYFCGSYNFENKETRQYQEFHTPFAGMPQVIRPDGLYQSQTRFGLYRWHIMDPVRFETDLRVTIQALGWRKGKRYLPLQDDIASVAYWYQAEPHAPFPKLPSADELEII
ncbi:MAG TPA: DUF2961 domain-containing protein [Terrimicrobiaceae bacterium]|nr:DUF2961 domain-containing protein [Terrimicrobiaceae bacterium]